MLRLIGLMSWGRPLSSLLHGVDIMATMDMMGNVQADRSDVMGQATKFTAAWCRHYGHYGYDGQC